jgi:hypothetical protein
MRKRRISLLAYSTLIAAILLLGLIAILWHPLYIAPPNQRWTVAVYLLITVLWLPVALIAACFLDFSSKKQIVIGLMLAFVCIPLTCFLSAYAVVNIALDECMFSKQLNHRIVYACRLSSSFEKAQYDMFDGQQEQPFMIYRGRVGNSEP